MPRYDFWWTADRWPVVMFGKWTGHPNNPSYEHIHENCTLGM
ncbi:hypothetical protein [Rhizobium phage RHph_X3_9]|nr:hypothetical protein [Rhizobium phage RHph_X3_9]